jgi:hypothetical protein
MKQFAFGEIAGYRRAFAENNVLVKQKGMVFGFRKTVTAVTRPER